MYTFTNYFSRAQLRFRIAMLNRPESSHFTWLKYPVLCIAALTVATVFARPTAQTLKKFVAAPVAETVASVISPAEEVAKPIITVEAPVRKDTAKQTPILFSEPEPDATPSVAAVDSVRNASGPDSTRTSSSRYIAYEGSFLYWVVTPAMTFDDFALMRQEFAKYGHQMQVNELKFDPLYIYIDRIVFSVVQEGGGSTQSNDTKDDNKPIASLAGYFGIAKNTGGRGTGSVKSYDNNLPRQLREVAAEDEAAVAQLVKDSRLEGKIHLGYARFAQLGSGSATYKKDNSGKGIHKNSGLIVGSDGSLAVDKALGDDVKFFVNNEPVTREAVSIWSVKQLYAVVKKLQIKSAKDNEFTTALLIYVNEDN